MTKPVLHTISNNGYQAVISSLGAELKSLQACDTHEEYIWSGDPTIWKGTAPILFPIVGRLKNGEYTYQGKTYQLDKHGLARSAVFELVASQENQKTFRLTSSNETLKHYPFAFEFSVTFSMQQNTLDVQYEVRNTSDEPMLFTLGSHPAFSLPLEKDCLEDYFLVFEQKEQLDCYFLENDLLCTNPMPTYLNNTDTIQISAELFKNDALIFKNIKSRKVAIHHKNTGERLTLDLGEAPHFGLWAKAGAPFICLEPWFSYDDTAISNGALENKPGILQLPTGETFTTNYQIIIKSI